MLSFPHKFPLNWFEWWMRGLRKGRRLKNWCIPIFRRASPWESSPPYRFLHQRCALLCAYNTSSITFLPFSTSKLHSTTFNVSVQHTRSINYSQSDPHTTVLWNTGYSTERRERSPQWEWSTVKCVLEICPETLRSPRLHVWVSEFIKKEVSSSSIFF